MNSVNQLPSEILYKLIMGANNILIYNLLLTNSKFSSLLTKKDIDLIKKLIAKRHYHDNYGIIRMYYKLPDGSYHGKYEVTRGSYHITGTYRNNEMHGTWRTYIAYQLDRETRYNNGILVR